MMVAASTSSLVDRKIAPTKDLVRMHNHIVLQNQNNLGQNSSAFPAPPPAVAVLSDDLPWRDDSTKSCALIQVLTPTSIRLDPSLINRQEIERSQSRGRLFRPRKDPYVLAVRGRPEKFRTQSVQSCWGGLHLQKDHAHRATNAGSCSASGTITAASAADNVILL
jgi:hypothetical protein